MFGFGEPQLHLQPCCFIEQFQQNNISLYPVKTLQDFCNMIFFFLTVHFCLIWLAENLLFALPASPFIFTDLFEQIRQCKSGVLMALPGWELPEIPNSKFPAPLATSKPIPTHGLILISCYGFWISSLGAKIHFFFFIFHISAAPCGESQGTMEAQRIPFQNYQRKEKNKEVL